jgi:glycosyltransferase involved in cell wall biosynthesis
MRIKMSAKVTVYMPVYNGADFIEHAIKSVLKQTYKNISLIISDNNSSDETILIVSKYLSDNRVTLYKQTTNIGALKNGNYLLDKIDTDYFLGLCHDDFLYDDKAIEVGLGILESRPEISIVYSNMMFIDKNDRPIKQHKYEFKGLVESNIVAKKSIIRCRNLYGMPVLVRTSSLRGFRHSKDLFYTADVDFSISVGKDHNIYYMPETLFAVRFHANNNTARNYSIFIEEFKRLAIKYNMNLSKTELLQMNINHLITVFKKHLFYFYLDKIRR